MIDNSVYFVPVGVYFTSRENSFLVLTPDKKNVLELKGVAFCIWQNLQKPTSLANLLKKIKQEYDVTQEELEKDLKNWLKEALKEKIIEKKLKT